VELVVVFHRRKNRLHFECLAGARQAFRVECVIKVKDKLKLFRCLGREKERAREVRALHHQEEARTTLSVNATTASIHELFPALLSIFLDELEEAYI
jgi:hypothetical protein